MNIFPGIKLNDTVSFQLYPSAIIGTVFNHCKITGVLDYDTAKAFQDIDALHANVYPTLPSNTPDDPRQYSFLKVLLPSGDTTIIGLPWVKEDSLIKHDQSRVRFTIENVSADDLKNINQLLTSRGYTAMEWEYR